MNLTDRHHINALSDAVLNGTPSGVHCSLHIAAEDSTFIRFNHAKVRQATQVSQAYATLTLTQGMRCAESTLSLTGDLRGDTARLVAAQAELSHDLPFLPEDPYLLRPDVIANTTRDEPGTLPGASAVIDAVATHAQGLDLVGFMASGPLVRAHADSRGQRNWHRVDTFSFDWCLYHATDKAVKALHAGQHWSSDAWARQLQQGATQLPLLGLPPKTLQPGRYRAYFAPSAVSDLLGTLAWGGFSQKEQAVGTSPLMRLVRGEAALHASVQLTEDTGRSIAPAFTPEGFTAPGQVPLVINGRHAHSLCSPRSAREFGLPTNGALAGENPQALSLAAGTLPEAEVLQALGTGLYISNLHYLNYSDRQHCRVTGMTRFACFWVENGELVAPLQVMRFDDDLLDLLGPRLIALTDRAELHQDTGTYGQRQLASITTPGVLVDGFQLTL
ncbi:MAG: metallopeptidase TldD-related protein [Aquabacterium sp.]|uniref:metallopeptidase TldD-related protein n=1 Tax=Aquabacterium sp. TaxID=1872578 RepID=UPI00271D46F9|nr:metallopeptidase TldD-related protein [Aquabacterium sp.]MDO9005634.1 metallopeptidase TldD-related protein [Aquabacterium sp.]